MVQCPFCHYNNEDGALFCEQCKSDLANVASSNDPAPVAQAVPVEAMPAFAEAIPVEAIPMEAVPMAAEALPMEALPMAAEALPMEATPVEAVPMEAASPFAFEAVPIEAVPIAPPSPPPPVVAALAAPSASIAPPQPALAEAVPAGAGIPPGTEPKLVVLRGQKRNAEYPLFEGPNFVGRADEKPVDVDLEDQEPPDRVWSSRQHACIHFEEGQLSIEDLNSSNGTFVNRARIYPGTKKPLNVNDVIQIGNVQLKVVV
jgi:pSer/pThr/pTyr-binding forkhead associated (FHA) protein